MIKRRINFIKLMIITHILQFQKNYFFNQLAFNRFVYNFLISIVFHDDQILSIVLIDKMNKKYLLVERWRVTTDDPVEAFHNVHNLIIEEIQNNFDINNVYLIMIKVT